MKRKTKLVNQPLRSPQLPVTIEMMGEMEERLNHRMDAGFYQIRSEFAGLKSEFSGLKSELHRVALLVEEQNARNKYVMDGLHPTL